MGRPETKAFGHLGCLGDAVRFEPQVSYVPDDTFDTITAAGYGEIAKLTILEALLIASKIINSFVECLNLFLAP